MIMKTLLLLMSTFFSLPLFAQTNYILETKNSKASLNYNGDILSHPNLLASGYEIPKNSGKNTVFAAQLWIGGIDAATGNVHASAQTYRQSVVAWSAGPISDTYTGNYDQVFYATRAQVWNHINNLNDPQYQIPQNFLDWPGNGDVNNGEPAIMAPFEDLNSNGIYEPTLGDYPKVSGASSAFIMSNDLRDTALSGGTPCCMGLDVTTYVYDMSYDDPIAENMLLLKYGIANRSSRTYNDVYIGFWADPDLGNAADDFVGSYPSGDMFFAYNGDNFDENFAGGGYENNPPAQGFYFLSHPMAKFVYYNNNSNPVNGNPTDDQGYYNLLSGKWLNGDDITFGGDGTDQNNPPTDFMFPGGSWTEEGEGNTPGDRRGMGSIGPFNLVPGQSINFDFALNFFWDSTVSNLANRDSLIARSSAVKNFYSTRIVGLNDKIERKKIAFSLYPNPTKGRINVEFENPLEEQLKISLINHLGKTLETYMVLKGKRSMVLDLRNHSGGIYILRVEGQKTLSAKKLVIR